MSDVAAPAPTTPAPTGQNVPPPNAANAPKDPAPPTQVKSEPKGNQEKPVAAQPEYFEVKVDGKTRRMTRDEVLRSAQLGLSAGEKFESAAAKEKKAQDLISKAKKNPIEALMDPELGLTKEQIRDAMEAWYAQEFIEPQTLTEDQRKVKAYEKELKAYKDKESADAEKARAEKEESEVSAFRDSYNKQIIETLEKSGLPKSRFTAGRIAFYMAQAGKKGFEAPVDLIISQVKNEQSAIVSNLADACETYEQLLEAFGESTIQKIRQADLKALRERRERNPAGQFAPSPPSQEKSSKVDYDEVNRRLRAMRMGK